MTTLTTKSIKDYLPFYVGCEAMVYQGEPDGATFTLIRMDYEGKGAEWWQYRVTERDEQGRLTDSYLRSVPCELIKPILRNLSDMTEEEKLEIFQVGESDWRQRHRELKADQFIKLLSKGFDLFNLIPEGLAIDKQTLKQLEGDSTTLK